MSQYIKSYNSTTTKTKNWTKGLDISQRRYTNGQQTREKILNITSRSGNANQKWVITVYPLRWLLKKASVGKDMAKTDPLRTVAANVKRYGCCGKQYDSSSEN